jgi:hypothetical protein
MYVEYICDRDCCNEHYVWLKVDTLLNDINLANDFLNEDFSAYTDESVVAAKAWVNAKLGELYSLQLAVTTGYHSDADLAGLLGAINIVANIEYAKDLLVLKPVKSDGQIAAELLQGLSNGEVAAGLTLSGGVMTLTVDGNVFVLKTGVNNLNQSGKVDLGDGYFLVFDIAGNDSNIKWFYILQE